MGKNNFGASPAEALSIRKQLHVPYGLVSRLYEHKHLERHWRGSLVHNLPLDILECILEALKRLR
jgi:hypothetical protein